MEHCQRNSNKIYNKEFESQGIRSARYCISEIQSLLFENRVVRKKNHTSWIVDNSFKINSILARPLDLLS
jgi:hypothetical protein